MEQNPFIAIIMNNFTLHPSIYIFIDVTKHIQSTTYIKIRGLDTPATLRRSQKEKVVYAAVCKIGIWGDNQKYLYQIHGPQVCRSHRFLTFYHFKLLKHRDFYYSKCIKLNGILVGRYRFAPKMHSFAPILLLRHLFVETMGIICANKIDIHLRHCYKFIVLLQRHLF